MDHPDYNEKKRLRSYYARLSLMMIAFLAFFNLFSTIAEYLCSAYIGGGFDKETVDAGRTVFYSDPRLNVLSSYAFPMVGEILAIIIGMAITGYDPFKKLRFSGFDGKDLIRDGALTFGVSGLGAVAGVLVLAAVTAISSVFGGFLPKMDPDVLEKAVTGNRPLWIQVIVFLDTCILGPVVEELLFRGVLLQGLRKHGNAFGIIFSSILFGLCHQNLGQCFSAMAFGLCAAVIAVKTDSLMPGIILHVMNNTFSSVLLASMELVDITQLTDLYRNMLQDPSKLTEYAAELNRLIGQFVPVIVSSSVMGLFRMACLLFTLATGYKFYIKKKGRVFASSAYSKSRTWGLVFTSIPWLCILAFLIIVTFSHTF